MCTTWLLFAKVRRVDLEQRPGVPLDSGCGRIGPDGDKQEWVNVTTARATQFKLSDLISAIRKFDSAID